MAMGSAWEDDFGMSPTQEYRHWEDYRRLKDENAKLRELLSSYWKRTHSHVAPNVERDYLAEMRELGVEVE